MKRIRAGFEFKKSGPLKKHTIGVNGKVVAKSRRVIITAGLDLTYAASILMSSFLKWISGLQSLLVKRFNS